MAGLFTLLAAAASVRVALRICGAVHVGCVVGIFVCGWWERGTLQVTNAGARIGVMEDLSLLDYRHPANL
jgi:hypothetical protein